MKVDLELERRMQDYNCRIIDEVTALFSADRIAATGFAGVEKAAARLAEADHGFIERLKEELK